MQAADRLLGEAFTAGRVTDPQPLKRLVSLLPHLPEEQQAVSLQKLTKQLKRSCYNLHVATASLHLISVLLDWLAPDALTPAPAVLAEMLELLGLLGGHRASSTELRRLFVLLQGSLAAGGGSSRDPVVVSGAAPAHASAEQLLRLFIQWCEPSARPDGLRDSGPRPPRAFFDLDGSSAGLRLPAELGVELVARGAFSLGAWLRWEDERLHEQAGGTDGLLLFSMMDGGGEAGVEVFLRPTHQTVDISVHGAGTKASAVSTAARLLRRKAPPERVSHDSIALAPGRWHHLLVCFRKSGNPLQSKHETIVYLDGQRRGSPQACAFPSALLPAEGERAAAAAGDGSSSSPNTARRSLSQRMSGRSRGGSSGVRAETERGSRTDTPSLVVGSRDGRPGFLGQLGTVLLMRGCASDAVAAAFYRGGTQCADLEACAAAGSGGGGTAGMIANVLSSSGRPQAVLAAYAAATAHGGHCEPVQGDTGLRALVGGAAVLSPSDVRTSLGGPLPLLPLIDQLGQLGPASLSAAPALLPTVVHALTTLMRGDSIYQVELERTFAAGMLGHLLLRCPAAAVTGDLLASFIALEAALEPNEQLSDQLLLHVFLRLGLWAKGGEEVLTPLMRQLYRMAGERPDQWMRVEGTSRSRLT